MDDMSLIKDAITGLADEVTMNPDVVTANAILYTDYLIVHREEIGDIHEVESMLHEIAQYGKWQQKVYLLSVLIHFSRKNKYIIEMIHYIDECFDDISLASINYIRYQLEIIVFNHSFMASNEISILLWQLYNRIMNKYVSFFSDEIESPLGQTNSDFVVVFTEQLISEAHGPSKSALDRCKILMTQMKKSVILINTAEMETTIGMVPFYGARKGAYDEDLLQAESIAWKGVNVPYVQLNNNMPESNDIRGMMRLIRRLRPCYGISIGGGNVVVSLAAKIMPILTVGMVFSNILPTSGWYQTYSKDISTEDLELLSAVGRDESHIIKAVFGSSIVSLQEKRTKEMLGLEESDFTIILVGRRIHKETDYRFWEMIRECNVPNLHILILGLDQGEIQRCIEGFEELQGKVHGLGMQGDPLGYMCAADLYVNPKRRGGGTSCVEAMSLGIPAVTLNFGDVAVNAGEDFSVETYEEMREIIEKYSVDKEFYNMQSDKAKKRAEKLLNAEGAFVDIVNEFEKRIRRRNNA